MLLAIAALFLQLSPAQPLINSALRADQPVASASLAGSSEPAATASPLTVFRLPLTDLTANAAASTLLSTPDIAVESSSLRASGLPNLLSALPSEPIPAASVAVQPQGRPFAAGLISVLELQADVRRQKRTWYLLAAVEHGAAVFDAWSTRRAIANGGQEMNPLMKPFAHSGAIYAATQAGPLLFDYIGKRMMMSRSSKLRRIWWLPQMASTASSFICGVHNLGVH
jgi:hypothetical protein